MWSLVGLLTLLAFYHALFYPPTSWDALMYYLEHPRRSVAEGGFPTVVASQVGMGLAANYPPLFRSLAAGIPSLTGSWNPMVGQFAGPWAGLLATLLVYAWLRRRFDAVTAAAGTLAYRALPYSLVFSMQAGHYAWTMAAVAAFLWAGERALAQRSGSSLLPPLLFAATAASINYLMPALLLPAAVLLYCRRESWRALDWKSLVAWTVALGALGGFWYLRNWMVAGNPVYPFFASIFGGHNIHPEVMASARIEWALNGDGLARWTSVLGRIAYLPHYCFWEPNIIWKLQPILFIFGLPGLFIALGRRERGWWMWASLLVVFLTYGLTIGAYYLYHLLPVFPLLGLFAASLLSASGPRVRGVMLSVLVLLSLGPSLGAALIGPHVPYADLWAFAHPNPPRELFLSRCPTIDGDVELWRYLSEHAPDAVVLTHDNRTYYLPLSVRFLNLDDPAIWPLYDEDDPAVEHARFVELGATHYLYIRNQENHPILSRLSLGDAARGRYPQYYRLVKVAANGDALFEVRR
ncbi:glycosyltransferase family 39 protein [bacterium]|nr:glycosyltransferase family 39 protein [bacterium]